MLGEYILEGHTPVLETDGLAWAQWMQSADRRVARDEIAGVVVSTVFLGLDHSFGGNTPVLFETMVFGGALDQEQDRYSTWEEAEAGHAAMVGRVRGAF